MERREAPGGLRDPLGEPCDRPAGTLARRSAPVEVGAAPPGAPHSDPTFGTSPGTGRGGSVSEYNPKTIGGQSAILN